MKGMIMNRLFRFMTIGLILCIVFITGCSKGARSSEFTGAFHQNLQILLKH